MRYTYSLLVPLTAWNYDIVAKYMPFKVNRINFMAPSELSSAIGIAYFDLPNSACGIRTCPYKTIILTSSCCGEDDDDVGQRRRL